MSHLQMVISYADKLSLERVHELAGTTYEPMQCIHIVDCPFTHCVLSNAPSISSVGSVIAHLEYPPPHKPEDMKRILHFVMGEYNGIRGALEQLPDEEREQAEWILRALIYLLTLCHSQPHQIQSFFNPKTPETVLLSMIYQMDLVPLESSNAPRI